LKKIKLALLPLVAVFGFQGCYFETIDSTEVGVEKSGGVIAANPTTEGFAFSLNPLASMTTFNVKQKKLELSAKQAAQPDTEDIIFDAPVVVLTSEQLQVPMDMTVLYKLAPSKAPSIMREFGNDGVWDDKLVISNMRSVSRQVIGMSDIDDLIAKRAEYEHKIVQGMNAVVSKYGVTVEQVMIRDIAIPQQIQESVKRKLIAEQEAGRAKFDVEKAKQDAQVEIEKQKGIAEANRHLVSSLTPALIDYKRLQIKQQEIEKWNGAYPSTMVNGSASVLLQSK
jgi:regulator of protease activity HflC (stomatin/prohibitin superfamily)